MSGKHDAQLQRMEAIGWRIERFAEGERLTLPSEILRRYSWMPQDYRELVEETEIAASPDDKAWLLTALDFAGQTDSAFAWNEWEKQSLEAADGDDDLEQRIRSFWDDHLPVLMSVKSGYAYFAIERATLRIVCGEEPEYEEASPLAASFAELLQLLATADPKLARWI